MYHISLLAFPFLATAAYCPAPPLPPSCGSLHPKWTLEPLTLSAYYTYTSPSASGPKAGYVSFTFKNEQVDYAADCKGVSPYPLGQFYGSQSFDCVTPGNSDGLRRTSFSFDQAAGEIKVDSAWSCGGDVVYRLNGTGKPDFKCKTETWENPAWKAGELYSNTTTVCEPTSLVIQL